MRLALAETAIQAAFRLRPDAGEAHFARAANLYMGYLDYDGALAELAIAGQGLPNDPKVFELKGYILRRQGKQEEALRNLERASELDPLNFATLLQVALSYDYLRRYADEKAALDRALAIEPNDSQIKVVRANVELDWKADTRPLRQAVDEVRANNPADVENVADNWLICALAERDPASAADALAALGENKFGNDIVKFSHSFVEGLIARMTNDNEKALSAFAAARAEQEKIVQAQPDYAPALCVLGLIEAALGRKEEALREGRRAVELLPITKDALNWQWHRLLFRNDRCVDRRKRSGLRTACQGNGPFERTQLWPTKADAVLGSVARRPVLRKDRRLPGAEIVFAGLGS